jgi:hypothetical protein
MVLLCSPGRHGTHLAAQAGFKHDPFVSANWVLGLKTCHHTQWLFSIILSQNQTKITLLRRVLCAVILSVTYKFSTNLLGVK